MVTKELTLQVCAKTETELDTIIQVLALTLNNETMKLIVGDSVKFDWNAETVINEKVEDLTPYYEIADRLYTKLLEDNRSFSDWEYKFISSNYEVAEAKGYYTPKQKEWLKKLEEKYL